MISPTAIPPAPMPLHGTALRGMHSTAMGSPHAGIRIRTVGTTERFDDTANSHTARANATARYYLAGYAFNGYGFSTCGYTGGAVGTTERFDDIANSHTSCANATARYRLAGYAFNGYGFTSCGYTTTYVGTTERFDDVANSHTARANANARIYLAGYAFPNLDNPPPIRRVQQPSRLLHSHWAWLVRACRISRRRFMRVT
jgi:hypothetical protein